VLKGIFHNNFINSQPSRSVLSAAFVITLAGLASRFLGLIRDRLLASSFGAGDTLDVYYAAFRIPDLIYNLLILGALSSALIPVFISLISQDREKEAWGLINGIMNILFFSVILISVIFFLFTPFIMQWLTPGFSPEKMAAVVSFTRIMFLSPIFLGISGIFGGILTSFRRFLVYSIAPVFYNIGIIIGVIFLTRILGTIGLAWGVVLGSFFHMLIQYPAAKKLGFRHSWMFFQSWKNAQVRKVFRLMLPRTLGIAVSQINFLVITIFASTLTSGSLAVFTFAQNLQSVPLGLFGISFAIAVFPLLSSLAAKEEKANFIKTFSVTLRQVIFFVIPLSAFIFVLRAQIVRVVLGSGKFDWEDTILTFQCLGIFAFSLFAQSAIPLFTRAFFSFHDTKTPFYIALVSEAINISLVIFLIEKMAVIGLALAFSIGSVIQALILFFVLRKKYAIRDDKNIIRSLAKIITASFFFALTIQIFKNLTDHWVDIDTFLGIFIQLSVSSICGLAIFILSCYLLKLEEFFNFKDSLTKRIFKDRQVIAEDTKDVSGI
jgi:putative peptidoglycan lipid II flippase